MSFVNKGELGQEEGSTQRPFGLGRYIGELVNFRGWGWVSLCSHLGQSLGLERRWDVSTERHGELLCPRARAGSSPRMMATGACLRYLPAQSSTPMDLWSRRGCQTGWLSGTVSETATSRMPF